MESATNSLSFSVGEFIDILNQSLEYSFGMVSVEGEVSQFKVNQNKFVFFDLKDSEGVLGCFMTVWQLRFPIQDGMKVKVFGNPKLTKWGKFSFTVDEVIPVGEGSIKKSADILFEKLKSEGIFDDSHKKPIPRIPKSIAIVSSVESAGYADFIKIANHRWGGIKIKTYHTQVQGNEASYQVADVIKKINNLEDKPDLIAVLRGGGSADDLAAFNDEFLIREVYKSQIPVVSGIGHEIDKTLIDYVADVRASTPSNAAEIIFPDKEVFVENIKNGIVRIEDIIFEEIDNLRNEIEDKIIDLGEDLENRVKEISKNLRDKKVLIESFNPDKILQKGYALIRGDIDIGSEIEIYTKDLKMTAEVKKYGKR